MQYFSKSTLFMKMPWTDDIFSMYSVSRFFYTFRLGVMGFLLTSLMLMTDSRVRLSSSPFAWLATRYFWSGSGLTSEAFEGIKEIFLGAGSLNEARERDLLDPNMARLALRRLSNSSWTSTRLSEGVGPPRPPRGPIRRLPPCRRGKGASGIWTLFTIIPPSLRHSVKKTYMQSYKGTYIRPSECNDHWKWKHHCLPAGLCGTSSDSTLSSFVDSRKVWNLEPWLLLSEDFELAVSHRSVSDAIRLYRFFFFSIADAAANAAAVASSLRFNGGASTAELVVIVSTELMDSRDSRIVCRLLDVGFRDATIPPELLLPPPEADDVLDTCLDKNEKFQVTQRSR